MQRDKITKKIGQIEKVASTPEKIAQSLTEVIIKFFKFPTFKILKLTAFFVQKDLSC